MQPAHSTPHAEGTAQSAYALVSDLLAPRPAVYHADFLGSAAVGWGALMACAAAFPSPAALPLFVLAVLGLYRAASFVHELAHLRPGAVPGFEALFNALVGIPLLLPSMLYAPGVHGLHHAKSYYGTSRDPEYLPIGRWPGWKRAAWVAHAAALPVALVLRFLVLTPLSALVPPLRRMVWARASSLSVNPAFARAAPPSELRPRLLAQEVACSAWAWAVLLLTQAGAIPLRLVVTTVLAAAAVGVLNQLRTLVAHRFVNVGDQPLSFEEQFLDSVNVPGSAVTALWAPVGLRYHGLHHLLPGLPYHALGRAHRRLVAALPANAAYHRVNEESLRGALRSAAALRDRIA